MSMRSCLAVLFGAIVLCGGQAAAQPASTGPIIQPAGLRQISAHVWAIPDNSVGGVSNIGIVVGSKATLVVDTGMGPRNGQIVLDEARKLSATNALYVVTTHIHPEHDLGAQAFPASARMIRSRDQVDEIAEKGLATAKIFAGRSAINAELLEGAEFRPADITYDKAYDLDLDGVAVTITAMGMNHTRGDTAIWVAAEGVLFTGDLAMSAAPAFNDPAARVGHWQATLAALAALKPAVVVPSHGPLGDATYIAGYQRYFSAIQSRTAALKREGRSADEAVASLTTELGTSLPNAAGRLAMPIRSAYAEAP